MTDNHWKRLGELLIARRVELGFPNRTRFAEAKGFTNTRVLAAIENAERTNFDPATLTQIEIAYRWLIGSIETVLQGGEPTVKNEADAPAKESRTRSVFDRLTDDQEEAQAEFERLAAELVGAEAKADAASRRVFAHMGLQENLRAEARRREAELGRPLTQIEWYAIDEVDRPTPYQVAEMIAFHCVNDPHEWTRYEMALVEHFHPDYPTDVTSGSRFADLSTARALVARLSTPEEGGSEDGEPSAQKSQFGLAAKPGQKEPDDEPQ